jgi:DNA-binding NarL/FixJ family response regulator
MNHRRLLLIDDEEDLLRVLGDACTLAGYEVALATDGEQAYQRVREQTFDLIVTDWRMPNLNGRELLRRLRREMGRSAPVILITAYGSVDAALQFGELGVRGYLAKPFPPEKLLEKVAEVLAAAPRRPHSPLTRREREVLVLLRAGLENKEIARKLYIAPDTANKHVRNILRKLGAHSRAEVVSLSYQVDLFGEA